MFGLLSAKYNVVQVVGTRFQPVEKMLCYNKRNSEVGKAKNNEH